MADPNELLKAHLGNLMVQIIQLQAESQRLAEENVKLDADNQELRKKLEQFQKPNLTVEKG